ncbi:efflux RND transporter periplasmic adaptor subunit [Phytoactinopolyspora halotolerans]|uniref:Efflux RND transporter periplasmic adaptor subunit n=1 Tax=Phytoactinopolyspora halotolerans TaxID=1981512 RepID=A0A6L9SE45_9ACTN|nr:efflux RND transporter periplasmic adaptor subunit [Phytoactinopolyspora halotolerans]NEE03546.1 efflux RND transporter periplasmic adaptor subunit [Phytoactinopolyspora halotolerans]
MNEYTTDLDDDDAEQPATRRPPRRRRWWLSAGVVALLAAGAGATYWYLDADDGDDDDLAAAETSGPVDTAEVTRETIADIRSFEGTLGHGAAFTVTTAGEGIVTRIADQGTTVERGDELFRLNERPVTALIGTIPMYRDLLQGSVGVDVEQLITNLTELGYADCTAEDEFTWCVDAAVRDWQEALGVEETGVVAQTDVVFVPRATRVDTLRSDVGGALTPGSPVLDITGSEQVVSLEIDVNERDLLSVDTQVTVELPSGDEVTGTVTAANVEPAGTGGGGGDGGDGGSSGDGSGDSAEDDALTAVEVTLADEVDDAFLGGPVDVVIEVDQREDVLTVPVNALLALAEGGHGVEVVADDGTTSIVGVETGLFAAGRVEVSGDGISEGTVVGVAAR